MATMDELKQRLLRRFNGVPEVTEADAEDWVVTALNEHGYSSPDDVPADDLALIMLYAQADGASQISLATAHYFSFTDKDQTVDKSKISDQYSKLADELWARYNRKKSEGTASGFGGSRFHIAKRVDRR